MKYKYYILDIKITKFKTAEQYNMSVAYERVR